MKDIHGTELVVDSGLHYVWLNWQSSESSMDYAGLTPKKARKLARKLRAEADIVEGIERIDVEPRGYTLTLTEDQAKTLAVILHKIGGDPGRSVRRYADEVLASLRCLGLADFELARELRFATPFQGAIYFEELA